jgi:hypothetical protein
MSSSNRRASLSPGERQRIKSRSSSQSHRTPSSQTTKRNNRETSSRKRSESSASNQSSLTSNTSKNQRSKGKTSKSQSSRHKGRPKRKKKLQGILTMRIPNKYHNQMILKDKIYLLVVFRLYH